MPDVFYFDGLSCIVLSVQKEFLPTSFFRFKIKIFTFYFLGESPF